MTSKDKCLNLSVIPQFAGTCWFNAILMVALYSEGVRQVLLKDVETWNKSSQFLMILKSILVKYYNKPEKTQQFFNKIRPEIILFKLMKEANISFIINSFKEDIKKDDIYSLGWYSDIIINLFYSIDINAIDITYINGKYLLNLNRHLLYYHKSDLYKTNSYYYVSNYLSNQNKKNKKYIIDENKNNLEKIPDIIFLKHYKLNNNINDTINDLSKNLNFDLLDTKNYKFNVKGLKTYNNIIELNGHKYKLDACLLRNYNGNYGAHAIAGITCNNKRYVYNGWNTQSIDPGLKNTTNLKLSPCSLMKYHWDLKKNESFCLNPKTCKLDFLTDMEKKDLCFSFAKGERVLVYVRIDDKLKNYKNSKLSIPSSLNLEDVSSIIKDLIDVKKLTDNELKEKIRFLFEDNKKLLKKNRDQLEKLYMNTIKKIYNYNKKIKQSPV